MYLEQTVTGLDTTKKYTLSVDYQVVYNEGVDPVTEGGSCYVGFSKGQWNYFIAFGTFTPADYGSTLQWQTYSVPLPITLSASTQDFLVVFKCDDTFASIHLDNAQLRPVLASSSSASSSSSSPSPSPSKAHPCRPHAPVSSSPSSP